MLVPKRVATAHWWISAALFATKRMLSMAGAWSLVGAAVGANIGMGLGGDRLTMFAHIIAGIIVLSCLGAALALAGGRPVPTWIGAMLGGLIATAVGRLDGIAPAMQLNLGIMMGALAGATLWPWFRMMTYLATRLRTSAQM